MDARKEHQRRTCTVPEFARIMGVSRNTAWNLVWAGKVRSLRLFRRVVIPLDEVERLLKGGDPDDRS